MGDLTHSHTVLKRSTLGGNAALISNIDHNAFNKEEAINKAKYGFNAIKHGRKGKPHKRRFYISEDDNFVLQWISPNKTYLQTRIRLTSIRQIEQG